MSLLSDLRAAGFRFTVNGGTLLVRPVVALTPSIRNQIKVNKSALMKALEEERQAVLNAYEPDFSAGPVQLAEVVLVDVFGELRAFPRASWEALCAYNQGKT